MGKLLVTVIFLLNGFSIIAQSDDSTWFRNNYTKIERQVPMRDGTKLFTAIYLPKDQTEKHPFLITRTPYSCAPYGDNNYLPFWGRYQMAYLRENYIIVLQDVRGRYMSEGKFVDVRPFIKNKKQTDTDEASDTFDTLEWLVKNVNNNNGKAGAFGTSYPGFYSTEAALSGHPALKAVSPQAPVTDWFIGDDFHHKGAFFAMDAFSFYPVFGKPHPVPTQNFGTGFTTPVKDNYQFYLQTGALPNLSRLIGDSIEFWHQMMQHPDYDAWWQARNARNGLYDVQPAMLWVGGLFDAEDCWGAWNAYKACETQSPQTNNKIVMGPWYHGQWSREGSFLGNLRFEANTAAFYQQEIEIPFFNFHLKGKGSLDQLPEATIFFTGENQWKKFDKWPPAPATNTPLYLLPYGDYLFDKTKLTNATSSNSNAYFTSYTSDPAHPVPYTEDVHERRTREYMTDDQRFAERRPDVLSFKTPVLTEDLTVAGPVIAELVASISTTDADFVVKLIDEFPPDFEYPESVTGNDANYPMGGYQLLVRGEIMRGKYRNSFSKPEAFVPGKITKVEYELPDVAHTFKKGHRLVIQVQSSWFPLADRNPQQFLNIYKAKDADFKKSEIRIFHNAVNPTKIILPVLK